MRPIALLTDFGTRDPYVAAMKGVLAARTSAPIHDLSHDIAPFDVLGAAWFLSTIVRYWPAGTIFVCVVDPGVGTARDIIAVESEGRVFLAPDNGLLTFVGGDDRFAKSLSSRASSEGPGREGRDAHAGRPSHPGPSLTLGMTAHAVTNEAFFLPHGSNTFHGRDRFAPVAAAIAEGASIADLGPRLESYAKLRYERPSYGDVVRGTIVAVDRFGNAITDVERAKMPFPSFALRVREHTIDRVEENYGNAAPGAFLIVGSTGCIEISVANASAAERLQLRRLERVELWGEGAGGRAQGAGE